MDKKSSSNVNASRQDGTTKPCVQSERARADVGDGVPAVDAGHGALRGANHLHRDAGQTDARLGDDPSDDAPDALAV